MQLLLSRFSAASVSRYTAHGLLRFYDKVNADVELEKSSSDSGSSSFAQMKCSCGEFCTLVNGLTSCCKKSVDGELVVQLFYILHFGELFLIVLFSPDLLFDLFGEMYVNRKKAFAIKVDRADGEHPSVFYVGNYGSEPELSQVVDASER